MKRIVYQNSEGVNVVYPVIKPGETEDQAIERVRASKAVPQDLPHFVVDEVPSTRFRNAWVISAGKVEVDLQKAKDLLEAEIPLRKKASPSKVAAIRAGLAQARSVAALEALAQLHGWDRSAVQVQADSGDM